MINHKCRFHLFSTHNNGMQCESVVSTNSLQKVRQHHGVHLLFTFIPSQHIHIPNRAMMFFLSFPNVLMLWHAFHRTLLFIAAGRREKKRITNPALIDDSAVSRDKRHAYFSFGIIFKNVHFTTCHRLLYCCFRLVLSSFLLNC